MQLIVGSGHVGGYIIYAVHADSDVVPPELYNSKVLTLLRNVDPKFVKGNLLSKDWQQGAANAVALEAARRIEAVFPAAMQATAALQLHLGPLPPDHAAEVQRGLDHIAAVRAAAKALITKTPANPGADQHWPKPIAPVKL